MIWRTSSMPVCDAASISSTSTWRNSMIASQWTPRLRHVDRRPPGAVGHLVIQAARQNPRRRGLADAADAGEHPGLRDAAGLEGIRQGADHRLLADQILEGARAVFAGQDAIGRAGSRGSAQAKSPAGPARRPRACRLWFRPSTTKLWDQTRGAKSAGVGGWTKTRSVSLGLLPSGPDPVGE